jgi:phage terminase Nu1 subunit (DNA packaging protein)
MNATASAIDLARLIGVTDRTVRELAKKGIVVKAGRGLYRVEASVLGYCNHLREIAAGRSDAPSLTGQRIRLAKEQADAQALKNAALRGELVDAAAVDREWQEIVRAVRSRMLAIPSRLQHLTAADVSALDREIRDALTELSHDGTDAR